MTVQAEFFDQRFAQRDTFAVAVAVDDADRVLAGTTAGYLLDISSLRQPFLYNEERAVFALCSPADFKNV